jgi:hypothetical protein
MSTDTTTTTTLTTTELRDWTQSVTAGEYLALYDESDETDAGARCGYDDRQLDEIRRALRARGLCLHADGSGLRVERAEVAS